MLPKPVLTALLFLFCRVYGLSQAWQVQSITVADGLSQGFVSSLYEDSRGFVWIGTFNGLNRYDGYRIKRFTPDNMGRFSFKANFVNHITEDANGLLWIATDKGAVVFDPYTERFVHLAETVQALPKGEVSRIIILKNGQIWMCYRQAGENGVCRVFPPADLLRRIRTDEIKEARFEVRPVRLADGLLAPLTWVMLVQDSILGVTDARFRYGRIDPTTLQVTLADPRALKYQPFGNYGLLYTEQRAKGYIFLPGDTAGQRMANTRYWSEFPELADGTRLLWRTGDSIIYRLEMPVPGNEVPGFDNAAFFRQFKPLMHLDQGISNKYMIDRAGNLWVGTTGYGVRKISRRKLDFRQFMHHVSCSNFAPLPGGYVWPGLFRPGEWLNLRTNQLEPVPWKRAFQKHTSTYALLVARTGTWWMAAAREEHLMVCKKEPGNSRWVELPLRMILNHEVQIQLLEDRRGNIWVGGNNGELARIRAADNHTDIWQIGGYFPDLAVQQLRSTCLVEDRLGVLWLGTNYGLLRVEHPGETPAFQAWHNYAPPGPLFKSDWILSVYPDPNAENRVWLGTRGGGLNCLDISSREVLNFTEKDGLNNNVVYGILPDSSGYLWLSTNRGISRFNLQKKTFVNYNNPAELNTEFNTGGYRLLPSGELAFGSIEGLFFIRPQVNTRPAGPVLTAVTQIAVNGKEIDLSAEDARLHFAADNSCSLQLAYHENNLALEFAALHCTDPASAEYRYRVNGLNDNWTQDSRQRAISLVGLPPGKYILELQSKDPGQNWDVAPFTRIYLCIDPPWYRSWLAYLLYTALILWMIGVYVRFERRRLQLKHAIDTGRAEMERLKSLDDFKNRFFTYITHEFKTPLTIIQGMAKRLAAGANPADNSAYAGKVLIQSQHMLELVDQMVDIAKLDSQQLHLHLRQGDINRYLQFVVESLRPLAEFKDVGLYLETTLPGLVMDFDPPRLKHILNNLIGNAIRHTPAGGTIRVSAGAGAADRVEITVADTGTGILPQDLPHIFDRYYQGGAGSREPHHFGLGLAFVKDLLALFDGTIEVASAPGEGTQFRFSLPIHHSAPAWEPVPLMAKNAGKPAKTTGKPAISRLPLLLVVEDNPVIADYLTLCLAPHFQLQFAKDGEDGLQKALETIPDLVLSDVMMPRMDGLELTHQLKTRESTGHIPVVLLSAKSELSDRLSAHQLGANAYIGKPFDEQELTLVLKNMVQLQAQWRDRYAPLLTGAGMAPAPDARPPGLPDETLLRTDAFMQRLYALFEANFQDDSYELPRLCRDLEISKSQLQRKLVALSGQSAMELLRGFRLQKARNMLLENPDQHVKEICFRVGFKDPAHFSRVFTKAFGVAPNRMKGR